MAIPIGTTGRHLESIARWMLAGVVVVGMFSWWYPGYRIWGALTVGVIVVWMLWLLHRTVLADRTISSHPIYLVLCVPAGILTVHAVRDGLLARNQGDYALGGALDMSMIFHLWLLGTAVLLTQSLLPRAASHVGVLSICGAAMMGGALSGVIWGASDHVRGALGFVAFAGVCVWFAPLWSDLPAGRQVDKSLHRWHPLRHGGLRIVHLAVGAGASILLAWFTPFEAVVSLIVLAAVGALSASMFSGPKVVLRMIATVLPAMGIAGIVVWVRRSTFVELNPGLFGLGEGAFAMVSARDSGLAVFAGTIGWVGVGWLLGALLVTVVVLMHMGRGARGDERGRVIVWMTAAVLVTCALLAPAGPFIPSVTLGWAFIWGLLPAMLGRDQNKRSGVWVLVVLTGMMVLLGLVRRGGLVSWSASALGGSDFVLHLCAGFILGLVVVWLMGSRSIWWGLLGIALAVLVGGAGEVLQAVLSQRSAQFSDWWAHAVGCALGLPLYLLCLGSRWCESPDARAKVTERRRVS